MNAEPAKAALRQARRAQRPPQEECPYCLIEHHVLGRKHDSRFIIRPCEYHHALVHEQLRDAGTNLLAQKHPVRRQIEILKVEAFYLRHLAQYMSDWSQAMERQIADLERYLEQEKTK